MSEKDGASSWSDTTLGMMAAAGPSMLSMLSKHMAPVSREKLEELNRSYRAATARWNELDRKMFDLWVLRMEGLEAGRVPDYGEEMEDQEERRLYGEASAEVHRTHEDLERGKKRFEEKILGSWRMEKATVFAVRMMAGLLRRMGVDLDLGADQVQGAVLFDQMTTDRQMGLVRGELTKLWKDHSSRNPSSTVRFGSSHDRAERVTTEIVRSIEDVLRWGRMGWSAVPEGDLVNLSGTELRNKYAHAEPFLSLDEALVKAFRPDWRAGDYEEVHERETTPDEEATIPPNDEVEVVDYKDSKQVAEEVLHWMDGDNDRMFDPTEEQRISLAGAVETMMAAGLVFDTEVCLELAAGEESEREEKYSRYEGWKLLNETLEALFEGPSRP